MGNPNPVQSIIEDLRADFKENSELLTILFMHADPQVATTVANAIKNAYLENIVYNKRLDRNRKVTTLRSRCYGEAMDLIKAKKASLQKAAENSDRPDPVAEQRMELNTALRDAKMQKSNDRPEDRREPRPS